MTIRMTFAAVVGVAVCSLAPMGAQVRAIDAERMLAERFGFTPAEVAQARSGDAVAKSLPTSNAVDLGVIAAVKVASKADRLAYWFNDIGSFRKAAQLGLARRISAEPRLADFADLSVDAAESAALKDCRPGKCDLMLGDKSIARFQSEVDWTAADPGSRASAVMREEMLEFARGYLAKGDAALGAIHHEKTPVNRAEAFQQVLWPSKSFYDIAPDLAAYLEGFPAVKLAGAESYLYWAKSALGSDASTSLHHLVIHHAPGGDVYVVDKQLFTSRYVDSMLLVVLLASAPDGQGFYVMVGARARSSLLGSLGARMLRGKVDQAVRDQTKTYVDWIRACLVM